MTNNCRAVVLLFILSLSSNIAVAQKIRSFNKWQEGLKNNVEKLDFESGYKTILDNEKFQEGRNKLVYFLERGAHLHYLGEPEESNIWLNKADFYMEDYYKQTGDVVLSYLSNPTVMDYAGEAFEVLYINYYKALNYLALNKLEEARVEVMRMNNLLSWFNDKYPDNKFKKDAYIHLVMGLIYDANGEYNDACIAYKNAFTIYENEYLTDFKIGVPDQLVFDIARTARLAGLEEDFETYSAMLTEEQRENLKQNSSVIIIWHNGLGPKKEAQIIEFTVVNTGGYIWFHDTSNNDEYKFAEGAIKSIALLNSIAGGGSGSYKMAFSKYQSRISSFKSATVSVSNTDQVYTFQKCEDINAIALKSLQDRKSRQLSNALIRLVVRESGKAAGKKAARMGLNSLLKNTGFGDLAGTVSDIAIDITANMLEKADLRQWSSLPHSIFYTRIYLDEGEHSLDFKANGTKSFEKKIDISIAKNESQFEFINTLNHTGEFSNMMVQKSVQTYAKTEKEIVKSVAPAPKKVVETKPVVVYDGLESKYRHLTWCSDNSPSDVAGIQNLTYDNIHVNVFDSKPQLANEGDEIKDIIKKARSWYDGWKSGSPGFNYTGNILDLESQNKSVQFSSVFKYSEPNSIYYELFVLGNRSVKVVKNSDRGDILYRKEIFLDIDLCSATDPFRSFRFSGYMEAILSMSFFKDVQVGSPQKINIDGLDLIKVDLTGSTFDEWSVYYFEKSEFVLFQKMYSKYAKVDAISLYIEKDGVMLPECVVNLSGGKLTGVIEYFNFEINQEIDPSVFTQSIE